MRKTTTLMLSFALTAGLAVPLAAAPSAGSDAQARGRARASQGQKPKQKPAKPRNERKQNGKQNGKQDRDDRRVIDRDGHVRVIRDYAREGLPPGLAKREQLPPGLRRQIRERGELPPGLQKRLVDVPAHWSARLPAIRDYERRYFAGDDLLVVDTRTNTIVAYVPDVLRVGRR